MKFNYHRTKYSHVLLSSVGNPEVGQGQNLGGKHYREKRGKQWDRRSQGTREAHQQEISQSPKFVEFNLEKNLGLVGFL